MMARRLWACIWLLLGPTLACADAPELKFLFPAGGSRGATTQVTCHGEFPWPVQVWSPGVDVTLGEKKGELQIYVPRDYVGDRVWIRLYDYQGASPLVPFLVGNLPELAEAEPNNTLADVQRLAEFASPPRDAEVTINGVLQDTHDVDAFAFELKQGQTLVAAVQANTAFGSPIDAILQIASTDGTTLAENNDAVGLDPRLAFTAPADGTYIARLFAFPAAPNSSVRFHGGSDYVYRLTLTTGPYVTHAIPMSVQECGADDEAATVRLQGWNLPDGARIRPTSGRNSRADDVRWVENSGSPKVGIVQVPNWGGTARIHIDSHPVLESLAETSEQAPLPIQLPSCLSGEIATRGAADHFQLELTQGQRVHVAVDAVELHSPLVPRVQLLDPAGAMAVETPEGGGIADASLTYTAKHDGLHRLTVADRFGHGGPRYFYRLTVSQPQTEFRLTVSDDRLSVLPGKPTELVVNVQRDNGGGEPIEEIEISAVGLPAGVSCEPVVSAKEGDTSKKVTLQFTASDAEPYSGEIQIQGKTTAGDRVRSATTPAKFGETFDRLWLTVHPKPESKQDPKPETDESADSGKS